MLERFPDQPILVQVVWEPVLVTDIAPPLSRVLGLIPDRRVIQYWDPDRVLSSDLVRAANAHPEKYGLEEPFPPDFVTWDFIAVFGKSARWEGDLPGPTHYGGPVVQAIEEARASVSEGLTY